jgi:hypothetical protein
MDIGLVLLFSLFVAFLLWLVLTSDLDSNGIHDEL